MNKKENSPYTTCENTRVDISILETQRNNFLKKVEGIDVGIEERKNNFNKNWIQRKNELVRIVGGVDEVVYNIFRGEDLAKLIKVLKEERLPDLQETIFDMDNYKNIKVPENVESILFFEKQRDSFSYWDTVCTDKKTIDASQRNLAAIYRDCEDIRLFESKEEKLLLVFETGKKRY